MKTKKLLATSTASILIFLFTATGTNAVDTTPPQILNVSQAKDVVEVLGDNIFHSEKGHNYLHGEFYDETGLDYAYVEVDIGDGNGFVPMKTFNASDFLNPTLVNEWTTPNGVREKISVQQYEDGEYIMMYGDNVAGDQAFHRLTSTDCIHFINDTVTLNEADHDQDINLILINGTLYSYEEDADLYAIGIHSSTDRGKTWVELKNQWNAFGIRPQSPHAFIWNDVLYVTGESWIHNGDWGYILIANGTNPTDFTGYDWIGNTTNHPEIYHHFAVKSIYIDKNDKAIGFLSGQKPDGTWTTWYVETTNTIPYPREPWTGWYETNIRVMGMERLFNKFILFGLESASIIKVYEVNGTIEKHYFGGATHGNWTYEFYESTLPNGTVVKWRFVVVDTSGNVAYSEINTFTIGNATIPDTKRCNLKYIEDHPWNESPILSITTPTFAWDWGEIDNPISYKLWVYSTDGSFNYTIENISHSQYLVGDHIEYKWGNQGEPALPRGKEYRWRVKCIYIS